MVVQKELINKLKDFGLNSYEIKLWTALLSRGVATAGELSDIANVPRSRSYDVLESLEKKGFVVMKLGKPIKYLAIPPSEVVERVKKNIIEEANSQTNVIEKLKDSEVLNELNSIHKSGFSHIDPFEVTSVVKGRDGIVDHLYNLIKNAKKAVNISLSDSDIDHIHELKSVLNKAKSRGVKISIAHSKTFQDADLARFADIRKVNNNMRFCSVDGSKALLMVINSAKVHPAFDFGISVSVPEFVATLDNMFEAL